MARSLHAYCKLVPRGKLTQRAAIAKGKCQKTQKAEAADSRAQGATLSELARSYDVSESTISRLRA